MPTDSIPNPATASATPVSKVRHPLLWVPSLYLAMGIPNVTVSVVAAIMYKNLGLPNEKIALLTSQMYWPWVLKPLWAPLLEPYKTKRFWVLGMEFVMIAALGLVAFSLPLPNYLLISLAFFWIAGFASATQDIAADAIYMTALKPKEQARYAGVQGMCWNAGAVLASGVLVTATGVLHDYMHFEWVKSWIIIMAGIAGIMAILWAWHLRVLPAGEPSALHGAGLSGAVNSLGETWRSFFTKKYIWGMLAVVFMYRFGAGFIESFGPLFLLDTRANGGLELSNQLQGSINGTVGTIGFIVGALLGGFAAAKMTLRRSFFILALALNVPHVTYYLLSVWMPHNVFAIGALVTIEKFGFGFGSVGHMLYMMQQVAPGPFKMSHYAFATGVMALTKLSTGALAGPVYRLCGQSYHTFFIFVLVASIPPIIFAWFAPFPVKDEEASTAATAGH
jgi:MFS transporter, PAT family, beta-lactamase induction signal transducer AmpG